MPYRRAIRRSTRRRPRRYRRVSWYNRKYSTAQIARAAWRSAKYIRGLVNSEMFHLDQSISLAAQSSITHITGLTQGDEFTQRTGRSILLKSINLGGSLQIHPSVSQNTRIMIALVQDKQQVSDTAPLITDIFTTGTSPHTFLNANTLGRFTILWRKHYTLSPATGGGKDAYSFSKFTPMNCHIRYNGTTSTDIQKNGVYLVVITSEATNYPTVELTSRISWHDN